MAKIFHITPVGNLKSIFTSGFLFSKNNANLVNTSYTNIAYSGIQDRRCSINVPISPHGTLHDYVPFYFCPRSPMLYAISRGLINGYSGGQSQIVHIVSDTELVSEKTLLFAFSDGHAIMSLSKFYNNLNDLNMLDWEVIKSNKWGDNQIDPDRKRRKQSEFLVKDHFPCNLITEVGVMNTTVQKVVIEILKMNNYNIGVKIKNNWYYKEGSND